MANGGGMVEELCKQHTNLQGRDISKIKDMAESLDVVANLTGADIFIDCSTRAPDVAIVVAHGRPKTRPSLYAGTVVGKFAYRKNEPAVLLTLEIGVPTNDMRAVTQENKNVSQSVSPIYSDDSKVIGVLIAEKDITDHVSEQNGFSSAGRADEGLMPRPDNAKGCEYNLPYHDTDGIVMFDARGVSTFANSVAETIYRKLGYIDRLDGIAFSNMALVGIAFQEVIDKRQLSFSDVKLGDLALNIKFAVMDNPEIGKSGVVMLIRDETDLKAKEKELILKSVAIREIHHRVKNNLQTIASLLRMQSRRVVDGSVQNAFTESINRILSIAATHEILAQKGVDDVDIKSMLKSIKNNFVGQCALPNKDIRISIEGDTFLCNSDKACSIALVVNEIIQNSLKYAFDGRNRGNVVIEVHKEDTYCNISVSDDGVGFNVYETRAGSLGCKIIQGLVADKLRGVLKTLSSEKGTQVVFEFPLEQEMLAEVDKTEARLLQ